MWLLKSLYISISLGSGVFANPTSRHILHERRLPDKLWKRQHKLPSDTVVPMRIGLAQQNLHLASTFLNDMSDPDSLNYGKHWTPKQVGETFSASDETWRAIEEWLVQNNIHATRHTHLRNNWLAVNVTAKEAEELLRTEYFVHRHEESGHQRVACDEYWVPEALRRHVDYITPTVHFGATMGVRRKERSEPHSSLEKRKQASPFFHPASTPCTDCAPGEDPNDPKTYIGNCNDATTPACVRALYGVPEPSSVQPLTGARSPVACLEFAPHVYSPKDLKMFFTTFTNVNPESKPKGISSPSFSDGEQALPGGNALDGFDPGLLWEPNGEFQIIMAMVPNPTDVLVYEIGSGYGWEDFLDVLDGEYYVATGGKACGTVNATNVANVISISWTVDETSASPITLQRQCNEFMKLGMQGITVLAATGDSGIGNICTDPSTMKPYASGYTGGGLFTANFPASCPYVTAVGATAIPTSPPFTPGMQEVAAFSAIISGGGFSNMFTAESYQLPTLAAYHAAHTPTFALVNSSQPYNTTPTARGYPDISANGYQYSIYSNEKPDLFSGTSGSTPMVAGIIALINDERMAAKTPDGNPVKGSVGFINPMLYKYPEMMNDVVIGGNHGCGTAGFSCHEGWDPVTGLGTPNHAKMSAQWAKQP